MRGEINYTENANVHIGTRKYKKGKSKEEDWIDLLVKHIKLQLVQQKESGSKYIAVMDRSLKSEAN